MKGVATTGVIAAAATLVGLALAAGGSGQPAKSQQQLRVLGEITAQHPVDNPPAGESAGDLVVFTERLSRSGRTIGRATGTCVLISPPAGFQCAAIAELPEGQLMLFANVGEAPATGAITGGTGRFHHARGTFTVEPLGDGRERIVYRVLR